MGDSELASVLSRRRQEVDTRGDLFTHDGSGGADAVWYERTDSQFSPRSSERKSAIARLASVSPYGSREASPAIRQEEPHRPKIQRRASADAAIPAPPSALEDRARRSFAPRRASTGPVLKTPDRLGSARSASPVVTGVTRAGASPSPTRTMPRPLRAKAKAKSSPRASPNPSPRAEAQPSEAVQTPPVRTAPQLTATLSAPSQPVDREASAEHPDRELADAHGAVAENIEKFEHIGAAVPSHHASGPFGGKLETSTREPGDPQEAPSRRGATASARSATGARREVETPEAASAGKPAHSPARTGDGKGDGKGVGKGVCKGAGKGDGKTTGKGVGKASGHADGKAAGKGNPSTGGASQAQGNSTGTLDEVSADTASGDAPLRLPCQAAKARSAPPPRDTEASPVSPRSPSECSVETASTISCDAPPPAKARPEVKRPAQPKRATIAPDAEENDHRRRALRLSSFGVSGDTELSDLLETDTVGHTTTYDSSRQPSACSNASSSAEGGDAGLPTILTTAAAADKLPVPKEDGQHGTGQPSTEPTYEPGHEPRHEQEPVQEARQEPRQELREEPREELREELREEPKPRHEPKQARRHHPRDEAREECGHDPGNEPRHKPRHEPWEPREESGDEPTKPERAKVVEAIEASEKAGDIEKQDVPAMLAEPEPAPSPECRSALSTQTVDLPPAPNSPTFALSPNGKEEAELGAPPSSPNEAVVLTVLTIPGQATASSVSKSSEAASATTSTLPSQYVQVVTDPDLWRAVTQGNLHKLQELTATGLLHSGRVVDVNGHSILWNALAFQQIQVAMFLLQHFSPGRASGVDITEVHSKRQDTLLHLCLYIRNFSADAAELFQQLFLGIGTVWNKAALQAYRCRPNATQDTFLHVAAARLNFWVLRYVLSCADAMNLLQYRNSSGRSALDVLALRLSEVCGCHSPPPPALQQAPQPLLHFERYQPTADAQPAFADVELEVEEESGEVSRIPAHRTVLGAASRVLHEQLLRCAPGRPLQINPLCCRSKEVLIAALAFVYRLRLSCDFCEDGFRLWQLLCLCAEYDLPEPLWRYAKTALLQTLTQARFATVLPAWLEASAEVGLDHEEAAFVAHTLLLHHEVALQSRTLEQQSQALLLALAVMEHRAVSQI